MGRPSLEVRPRTDGAEVLAGYVDVHAVQVVRVGLGGAVRGRRTVATSAPPTPARAAELLAAAARDLLAESPPGLLAGVGVAVPGLVRAGDGVIAHAPNLDWRDAPFADVVAAGLEAATGQRLRVDVANDADLGLIAEHRRGAAVGLSDVVYLCGTYGLGGGVLTGGHPLTGHRGYAGEVGHVSVDPDGRACRCGSRGCWESETLAAAWAEPFDLDPDAPDIADLVLARLAAGGVVSRRTRDKLSRAFARGWRTSSTSSTRRPSSSARGCGTGCGPRSATTSCRGSTGSSCPPCAPGSRCGRRRWGRAPPSWARPSSPSRGCCRTRWP